MEFGNKSADLGIDLQIHAAKGRVPKVEEKKFGGNFKSKRVRKSEE
jgi:hypothetical protein